MLVAASTTDKHALRARYVEEGYLIVRGGLSPREVQALRDETLAICRGGRGPFEGLVDPDPAEDAARVLARYLCIHFPHKLSPLMREVLAHPAVVDALTTVIGPNVKCMQSMLFIKASGKPGQAWHQDEHYIPTRDRSLTGAWIALDDATVQNGCLWAIPGSHRRGVLYPQQSSRSTEFDCSAESFRFPYTDEDAVPLEVQAGDVVVFNGYLLHRSLRNRAPEGLYRRALVNHYMSAESFLPWFPQEGRHTANTDVRDIVLVAGEDPHAYRGTEDITRPHLRPSGESGCGSEGEHQGKD